MGIPTTYSGRFNIWMGAAAFSAPQITSANPKATSPKLPNYDSGTPYLWHFIELEEDGTVGVKLAKDVERQKSQRSGTLKIVGKAVESPIKIDFNCIDESLKNICQLAAVNPNLMTEGLTDGGISIESMAGLDITALVGRPFLLTHEEYGYEVSGGEIYPKLGVGADPDAILVMKAANISEVDLGGKPPQSMLGISLDGVAVQDPTRTRPSIYAYVELDLTGYDKET